MTHCLSAHADNAKTAAYSAAVSATRKEERKNEKEEVNQIYVIARSVIRACVCLNLYGIIIPINY